MWESSAFPDRLCGKTVATVTELVNFNASILTSVSPVQEIASVLKHARCDVLHHVENFVCHTDL